MNGQFAPQRHILPAAQRRLWPDLAGTVATGFVLYGGTAIALRLGHRTSVDFDFFSSQALDRKALNQAIPRLQDATTLQDAPDTFTCLVQDTESKLDTVKLSFFCMPGFGRVAPSDVTDDGVLKVAALADLLATKLKVILQRAEAKDYRDIAAILRKGADLAHGLGSANALFGSAFQPSEALKALTYFEDGDLPELAPGDKTALVNAAIAVRDIPHVDKVDW